MYTVVDYTHGRLRQFCIAIISRIGATGRCLRGWDEWTWELFYWRRRTSDAAYSVLTAVSAVSLIVLNTTPRQAYVRNCRVIQVPHRIHSKFRIRVFVRLWCIQTRACSSELNILTLESGEHVKQRYSLCISTVQLSARCCAIRYYYGHILYGTQGEWLLKTPMGAHLPSPSSLFPPIFPIPCSLPIIPTLPRRHGYNSLRGARKAEPGPKGHLMHFGLEKCFWWEQF